MKKFINDWLANFALIVLLGCIALLLMDHASSVVAAFFLQLLLVTLVIRLLQLLTTKFISNFFAFEYLVEFAMVVVVVLSGAWLFNWHHFFKIWFILLMIAVVYIIAIILDLTRTNRDVNYINEQIKQARMRRANQDGINTKKKD